MSIIVKVLTFGVGIYAGMYIAQRYEVPRVDDPENLYRQFHELLEKYKKK